MLFSISNNGFDTTPWDYDAGVQLSFELRPICRRFVPKRSDWKWIHAHYKIACDPRYWYSPDRAILLLDDTSILKFA